MDWTALLLSFKLSLWTLVLLMPIGVLLGRWIAWSDFSGRTLLQAVLALPYWASTYYLFSAKLQLPVPGSNR